jgi:HSP20 family protein
MRTNLDYPFESLRDLDTLMRGIFQREGGAGTGLAPYGVDIREDADHIYVEAELPGFRKDEVDVTLENQTLTIAAERRSEHQVQREPRNSGGGGGREGNGGGAGDGGQWLLNERRYTRFLRSFTLPPTVDEGSVQAKLNDGVLTITINKREETKPRKVKVG